MPQIAPEAVGRAGRGDGDPAVVGGHVRGLGVVEHHEADVEGGALWGGGVQAALQALDAELVPRAAQREAGGRGARQHPRGEVPIHHVLRRGARLAQPLRGRDLQRDKAT